MTSGAPTGTPVRRAGRAPDRGCGHEGRPRDAAQGSVAERPALDHARRAARLDVVLVAEEGREHLGRHREHHADVGGLAAVRLERGPAPLEPRDDVDPPRRWPTRARRAGCRRPSAGRGPTPRCRRRRPPWPPRRSGAWRRGSSSTRAPAAGARRARRRGAAPGAPARGRGGRSRRASRSRRRRRRPPRRAPRRTAPAASSTGAAVKAPSCEFWSQPVMPESA